MKIWRLTTRDTITEAFNGDGASKYGGRYNSKGTKVVYTSDSVSLAVLENLVHFDSDLCPNLFLFEIEITDLNDISYNEAFDKITDFQKMKKLGDEWARLDSSLILKVPSIIVPNEYNFLINPLHNNFKSLNLKSHGKFALDQRLIK